MIKRRFIILDELEKKCSACSQLVLIVKSLYNVEWDLKRVSNLIQIINDYNVANKYDLTWQTHFVLKCLNRNIIDEGIIITLKNRSLKG
jgi:hypothetical protein